MQMLLRVFTLLALLMIVRHGNSQPCVLGVNEIADLRDQLLPLRTAPAWKSGARKSMSVRYTPSDSQGEILLTFSEFNDGAVQVSVRVLSRKLSAQVDDLAERRPDLRCSDVREAVSVRDVTVPAKDLVVLRRLYRHLTGTKLRADVPSEIYLDTAMYEMYMNGGMADLALTLFPSSDGDKCAQDVINVLEDMIDVARSLAAHSNK